MFLVSTQLWADPISALTCGEALSSTCVTSRTEGPRYKHRAALPLVPLTHPSICDSSGSHTVPIASSVPSSRCFLIAFAVHTLGALSDMHSYESARAVPCPRTIASLRTRHAGSTSSQTPATGCASCLSHPELADGKRLTQYRSVSVGLCSKGSSKRLQPSITS